METRKGGYTLPQGPAETQLRVQKGELSALGPRRSVLLKTGAEPAALSNVPVAQEGAREARNPGPSLSALRKGCSGTLTGSGSHHQGGLGHRWLGSWGPGRSCNHHSGPSTSRCCRQQCPPVGQGPEGATPSTGQRGRISREAHHPIPPRSLPHEPHHASPPFESVGTF